MCVCACFECSDLRGVGGGGGVHQPPPAAPPPPHSSRVSTPRHPSPPPPDRHRWVGGGGGGPGRITVRVRVRIRLCACAAGRDCTSRTHTHTHTHVHARKYVTSTPPVLEQSGTAVSPLPSSSPHCCGSSLWLPVCHLHLLPSRTCLCVWLVCIWSRRSATPSPRSPTPPPPASLTSVHVCRCEWVEGQKTPQSSCVFPPSVIACVCV